MKITTALLQRLNACDEEIAKFTQLYPDGVELTADNLVAAYGHRLAIEWLTGRLPCAHRRVFQHRRVRAFRYAPFDPWLRWFAEDIATAFQGVAEDQLIPLRRPISTPPPGDTTA